jgi:halocyanin-like protein
MEQRDSGTSLRRRRFMQTTALLAGGGALATLSQPVGAQEVDLASWFSNVSNFDGVVDERGQSEVTVAVGASGNGGGFAYDPPAVRVDPGTEIVWEWTGEGGRHDVAAEDDSFGSELQGDAGDTFSHTFESEGITTYACTPHKTMGMKGAVVVGDVDTGLESVQPPLVSREPDYGSWFNGVSDFEGTADMRGREEVRIQAATDGEESAFSPQAVHVDPGTDVIWEWSGEESHAIEAADDSFASPEQSSGEWGLRFDGVGISKYASSVDDGMRGAVVVGNVFEGVYDVSTTHLLLGGGLGAAVLSPLAFGAFLWRKRRSEPATEAEASLEPAMRAGR